MDVDFSDFKKPLVVTGLILSCILGGTVVYNTVVHQIPALERREDKQDKNLDDKFNALGGSVNSLGLTVQGLQINMIRLCAQKRPIAQNCDVKALVSAVKRTAQIQAEFLAQPDMRLAAGSKQPLVTDEGVKDQLPEFIIAVKAMAEKSERARAEKAQLASAILWSSAADSARWHQDGNTVVVDFKNGKASFDLSRPTAKEHVGELVQSLNTTTEALKAAGSATPSQ